MAKKWKSPRLCTSNTCSPFTSNTCLSVLQRDLEVLLDGLNCISFEVCVELDLLSSQHNFWCSPRKIVTQMYELIVLFTLHRSRKPNWWVLHFKKLTVCVTFLLLMPLQGRTLLIGFFSKLFVQTTSKLFWCGRVGCQHGVLVPLKIHFFPISVLRARLFQWNSNLKSVRLISVSLQLTATCLEWAEICGLPVWLEYT